MFAESEVKEAELSLTLSNIASMLMIYTKLLWEVRSGATYGVPLNCIMHVQNNFPLNDMSQLFIEC